MRLRERKERLGVTQQKSIEPGIQTHWHPDTLLHHHHCLLCWWKIQKPQGCRWESQPPLWYATLNEELIFQTSFCSSVKGNDIYQGGLQGSKSESYLEFKDTMNACYCAGTLWALNKGSMHVRKVALLSKAQASWDTATAGLVSQQIFTECLPCAKGLGHSGMSEPVFPSPGLNSALTSEVNATCTAGVLLDLSKISVRSILKGLKVLLHATDIY